MLCWEFVSFCSDLLGQFTRNVYVNMLPDCSLPALLPDNTWHLPAVSWHPWGPMLVTGLRLKLHYLCKALVVYEAEKRLLDGMADPQLIRDSRHSCSVKSSESWYTRPLRLVAFPREALDHCSPNFCPVFIY